MRFDNTTRRTSEAIIVFVLFFSASCSSYSGNASASVTSPLSVSLSVDSAINEMSIFECVRVIPSLEMVSVIANSRGGFLVEFSGLELGLSTDDRGVWERVGLFLFPVSTDSETVLLMTTLRGSSTFSQSEEIPASGERWEPFDDQEQALALIRVDPIFQEIVRCLEIKEIAA